ncbi:MAG: hypothetical protein JWM57_532 [Phycisphaerales bacterium]|nr:hypothetical protein [Phycisphaerales bacterium]
MIATITSHAGMALKLVLAGVIAFTAYSFLMLSKPNPALQELQLIQATKPNDNASAEELIAYNARIDRLKDEVAPLTK